MSTFAWTMEYSKWYSSCACCQLSRTPHLCCQKWAHWQNLQLNLVQTVGSFACQSSVTLMVLQVVRFCPLQLCEQFILSLLCHSCRMLLLLLKNLCADPQIVSWSVVGRSSLALQKMWPYMPALSQNYNVFNSISLSIPLTCSAHDSNTSVCNWYLGRSFVPAFRHVPS